MTADEAANRPGKESVHTTCLAAEELVNKEGPEAAEAALLTLARAFPEHPAPRLSLAKLYRWLARRNAPELLDRRRLKQALAQVKEAVMLEDPPCLETLKSLHDVMHSLAMHDENASCLSEFGREHPDPRVRFHALCWAAISLECHARAVLAEGKDEEAKDANHEAVRLHRDALGAWPDAPVAEVLSSYLGGGHVAQAYSSSGRAAEWIEKVEALLCSEEGKGLPATARQHYLATASDIAVDGGMTDEALRLARKACAESDGVDSVGRSRLRQVAAWGILLRATHSTGDREATEAVAHKMEELMRQWEEAPPEEAEGLPTDFRLGGGYNHAARNFICIEDWGRAINMAQRATERWDFGPNHWFLAVALWAGRKDRQGTLRALRNAARDAPLSGIGACRNLRVDFLNSSVFADVRDDPEFLRAIQVKGVKG